MNLRIITHLVAVIVMIVGISMISVLFVSWLMGDSVFVIRRIAVSALVPLVLSFAVATITKPQTEKERRAGAREGFAIVTLGWLFASLFGCLPFILCSHFYFADAFFETVSGFTTTGASIVDSQLLLTNGLCLPHGIESLPKGILFWRSLTHWLGGMGIVMLFIAIMPVLGVGGQSLYNAEVTGVKSMDSQLTPRITETAKLLWGVYVLLTALQVCLLVLSPKMDLFDAICHSFSTIATGGFSTKNASIGAYHSAYIEWIVTIFMFLAGCNFVLHFRAVCGRPLRYFKDEEFRFYLGLICVAAILILFQLMFRAAPDALGNPALTGVQKFNDAFRASVFQVVSIITSTGFATANYELWPTATCVILFGLMFIGGCGGSTAGGMKCVRVMLLGKYGFSEIKRCFFPRMIPDIRLNQTRLEMTAIQKTVGFFALFVSLYFVFVLILPLVCEMDMLTAISSSITCLSNIGPGFGSIGPAESFSWMNAPAKLLLTVEMVIGRLELFTVLVLFMPSYWRK